MTAILGTWNPNKWSWNSLPDEVRDTAVGKTIAAGWSVSRRRHGVAIGDRFYVLKQEVEPRGIIASGTVSSLPFEDAHWNGVPGNTCNYVKVEFDIVLDSDDVLPLEELMAQLGNTHWTPQNSGTAVSPLDEGTLERL